MPLELDDVTCRLLGVLLEKALTGTGAYPLTLNALLAGANQKQNRDPVLELTEKQVAQGVFRLQRCQLVRQAPPSAGARANRFEHNAVEKLKWDRREQAVMAELMLRGRQTLGEIRNRAIRMAPIPDMAAAGAIVAGLQACDPPWIEELPREPGRSVNRFRHLLVSEDPGAAETEVGWVAPASPAEAVEGSGDRCVAPSSLGAEVPAVDRDVASRLGRLEDRVAALERVIEGIGGADGSPGIANEN